MNLEEINKWLEKEEGMSYTRLEELHDFFYERYTNLNCILSELEEWLKEHIEICKHNANIITEGSIEKKRLNYRAIIYEDTLYKIQELKEKYK